MNDFQCFPPKFHLLNLRASISWHLRHVKFHQKLKKSWRSHPTCNDCAATLPATCNPMPGWNVTWNPSSGGGCTLNPMYNQPGLGSGASFVSAMCRDTCVLVCERLGCRSTLQEHVHSLVLIVKASTRKHSQYPAFACTQLVLLPGLWCRLIV